MEGAFKEAIIQESNSPMDADHEDGPDKKRVRALKSCLICRQKKTKCDQLKPICGSCKKRKDPHQCHYEEAQWSVQFGTKNGNGATTDDSPTASLSSFGARQEPYNRELLVLNERIRTLESAIQNTPGASVISPLGPKPEVGSLPYGASGYEAYSANDDHREIDFQKNHYEAQGMPTHGSLSWVSLLRKDVYLNCIHVSVSNRNRIMNQVPKKSKKENAFKEKFTKETDLNAKLNERIQVKHKPLPQQIKETIVDPKLVWILIDRFFESEWCFLLPVLDRAQFCKQVSQVIGPRDSPEGIRWSLTKKVQYTTIGILLILMRLTSMSLYNAGKPIDRELTDEDKYLLDHQVPENVIRIVESCYREMQVFTHVKLDIFQFSLMMRLYEFYAPEECDCSTSTTIDRLGQMLEMAIHNGATREPSKTGVPLKLRNLHRRLWYTVVHLDFYQLMLSGSPSIIDANCYDTDFPHLDESETPLDYQIDKMFADRANLYNICTPLLKLILNVRQPPTVGQTRTYLAPLEQFLASLPTLKEILQKPSDTVIERAQKIKDLTLLIDVVSFLNMIYYHLFLNCNEHRNKDMSIFYLTQMLKNSNLVYPTVLFLDQGNKEYDLNKHFGCAVALIQKVELALHRIIQLMFTVVSRMKAYKTMVKNAGPEMFEIIDNIAETATHTMRSVIRGFDKISDYYYHAWVVSKCHVFITDKVLKMERGPLGIITTTDVQFMATIKKEMHRDDSVFRYTMADFQKILDSMAEIREAGNNDSDFESPHASDMLSEKDKRWLEQIIQDISVQSTDISGMQFDPSMNNLNNPGLLDSWNTIVAADGNGSISNGSDSSMSMSTAPTEQFDQSCTDLPVRLATDAGLPVTDGMTGAVPLGSNFEEFLVQYTTQQAYGQRLF